MVAEKHETNGADIVGVKAARIRALNDTFRCALPERGVMITTGVRALPADRLLALLVAVREFDAFNPGNDPHDEHDFGAVELESTTYFWKIDYYDLDHRYGSPDPVDPGLTSRVMTIMRADEY
ncbi:DUF3768 domain-containing protein [Rhizobium sp. P38BS-XIX]|uniref:DUF3768 domain-containing protein n=1 Tax=Rhizobium sp. P38BS-XIX TaxID=2726740 RepID=UPI0014565E47|nr:DUF3768 domain-containing protein [Rhizobium sp. P38BS-XIX]NLR98879.1 DUF3768 domain-containing protein [Rhizobium sp. P38BS-XIX]